MIIDDDQDIITTFKRGLEENGFSIDAFLDPFEALAKFKQADEEAYQLLMIDLIYEEYGTNGFKLYQEFRNSNKKLPHVCFITAYQDYYDSLRTSFPDIDAQCFIRKPIRIVDLVARLRQELQISQ
jgi:DNA-binding response OmpR family regulator